MAVVEVEDLRRVYRSRTSTFKRGMKEVEALRGVSFSIEQGELFGLLGPNGAGKTTTIKILTTLLLPTSGKARVLGLDPATQHRELRSRIGYVFGGDRGLYDRLSGLDNLKFFADVYRVPVREKNRRIDELLDAVGLRGRERERVETYSRGMRQRLHIARGLLHDPEVIFFDEPTIGLDPVGARELRQTVAGLREQGKTILLTTHYMFEADELCGRVAVIAGGRIVAQGRPSELKAAVSDGTVVEIETYGVDEPTLDRLRALDGVKSVSTETRDQAQVVIVQAAAGASLVQPLLASLDGVTVGKVVSREPTLEDAYVELVREA
jgi:ABC-2 type transport system ATP-binding protein